MSYNFSYAAIKRYLVPIMALFVALGVGLGSITQSLAPCLVCLALALSAVLLLRHRARLVALWVLSACVALCAGQLAYHPALPCEGDYLVSGIVSEEIRNGNGTQHKTVLRDVRLNNQRFSSGAYWSFYTNSLPDGLEAGVRVTFRARVYHPDDADNPGGYDFRSYLLGRGVTLGVYGLSDLECESASLHPYALLAKARHALAAQLEHVMGKEAGTYAATMLLGIRDLVPDEDLQAFRRLGIAHILSVSGFHVGVLYALATGLLSLLHVPKRWRLLPLAILLLLYAALTGFNAPVLRASLLLLLGEYAVLNGRQRLGLHALSASAIVLLLFSPAQLTSVSFQLTYGALLGLTLVAPQLNALMKSNLRLAPIRSALSCTLAAQLGILLPELYWFHELPLLGVVFNLLLMSVFSLLLGLYWLVAALMYLPLLGAWAGRVAAILTGLLSRAVHLSDGLPWLMLWTKQANWLTALGYGLLIAGLCCLWRHLGKKQLAIALCGAFVLALSLIPLPFSGTRYIQFSVSNADASLLMDGSTTIAIDTGEDGKVLATYLHQRRLPLDAVVLTHLHADHAGGLRALMDEGIPVGVCYLPTGGETAALDPAMLALVHELESKGTAIVPLHRGDTLALPSGSLTVLWPEKDRVRPMQDANLYSLTMLLEVRGTTLLLTGDLDGAYERYCAIPADVLKCAHHGSAASTSADFLDAVMPQCVLLSGGDEARLTRVKELAMDIPVYGTWERGAITLDITDAGFRVTPLRPQP